MIIYFNETSLDVVASDSSYRFKEIMGDNLVCLEFSLVDFVDFPIGSYVVVEFEKYTLFDLPEFTKVNERQYNYSLTFHSEAKLLENFKFRDLVSGRVKFTLTAQPQEYLEHIVNNLNDRTEGERWQIGAYIQASERTQSFSHNSIMDALNSVAELFGSEFSIDGRTISLRKVEHAKEHPLSLGYGKGNGFVSGISRKLGDEKAVDVVFVESGSRNIDASTYTYIKDGNILHADCLRLPRNFHGFYHKAEREEDLGTISSAGENGDLEFFTDADGFAVYRQRPVNNRHEESIELTSIYPHHTHYVEEVICIDADKHFYNIKTDTTINYSKDNIIAGETMTVYFNSGMLEGKEFDVSKYENGVFELVPQEIDGIIMPDAASYYLPQENNSFVVLHTRLPQEFIKEAEDELLLNAVHYMHLHSEMDIQFDGQVDGIWAKRNWAEISNRIGLGYYINFSDNKFAQNGKLMRITAIKDYLNNPHSPEITLSNTTTAQGISSEIRKIAQNEAWTEKLNADTIQYAKRNFRDSKESLEMLDKAFKGQYTDGISPSTVQTIMALIGDESLQYEFGRKDTISVDEQGYITRFDVTNYTPIFLDGKLYVGQNQVLRHRTFGSSNAITSSTAATSLPYWRILQPESGFFDIAPADADKHFYLYAVVSKAAISEGNVGKIYEGGMFELKAEPYEQIETADNYRLLVGLLNSEYGGERSFSAVFGKTEILGNRITTDVIKSNDGKMYIDLINGVIQGKFNFVSGLISNVIALGNSDKPNGEIDGAGSYYMLWIGGSRENPTFSVTKDGTLSLGGLMISKEGQIFMAGESFPIISKDRVARFAHIICSGEVKGGTLKATDTIYAANDIESEYGNIRTIHKNIVSALGYSGSFSARTLDFVNDPESTFVDGFGYVIPLRNLCNTFIITNANSAKIGIYLPSEEMLLDQFANCYIDAATSEWCVRISFIIKPTSSSIGDLYIRAPWTTEELLLDSSASRMDVAIARYNNTFHIIKIGHWK